MSPASASAPAPESLVSARGARRAAATRPRDVHASSHASGSQSTTASAFANANNNNSTLPHGGGAPASSGTTRFPSSVSPAKILDLELLAAKCLVLDFFPGRTHYFQNETLPFSHDAASTELWNAFLADHDTAVVAREPCDDLDAPDAAPARRIKLAYVWSIFDTFRVPPKRLDADAFAVRESGLALLHDAFEEGIVPPALRAIPAFADLLCRIKIQTIIAALVTGSYRDKDWLTKTAASVCSFSSRHFSDNRVARAFRDRAVEHLAAAVSQFDISVKPERSDAIKITPVSRNHRNPDPIKVSRVLYTDHHLWASFARDVSNFFCAITDYFETYGPYPELDSDRYNRVQALKDAESARFPNAETTRLVNEIVARNMGTNAATDHHNHTGGGGVSPAKSSPRIGSTSPSRRNQGTLHPNGAGVPEFSHHNGGSYQQNSLHAASGGNTNVSGSGKGKVQFNPFSSELGNEMSILPNVLDKQNALPDHAPSFAQESQLLSAHGLPTGQFYMTHGTTGVDSQGGVSSQQQSPHMSGGNGSTSPKRFKRDYKIGITQPEARLFNVGVWDQDPVTGRYIRRRRRWSKEDENKLTELFPYFQNEQTRWVKILLRGKEEGFFEGRRTTDLKDKAVNLGLISKGGQKKF